MNNPVGSAQFAISSLHPAVAFSQQLMQVIELLVTYLSNTAVCNVKNSNSD